jgi:hypothetical protein
VGDVMPRESAEFPKLRPSVSTNTRYFSVLNYEQSESSLGG